MSATFIGLNLAKSVFQIHGVDAHGKVVVTKRLRREAVLAFSREGRGSAFTGPTSTCQLVHPASLQQRPFVGYYLEGVPEERRILHNREASLKHLIGHAVIPLLPSVSQYPCRQVRSPSQQAKMAVPALPVSIHTNGSAR
jgi:hypothetical protein